MLTSEQMTSSTKRKVFTVARLNQEVERLLGREFGTLWVQAEISNITKHGSGHWYFTLKDSRAQISCAMFANRNKFVSFSPERGDEVLVRGKLGLYAARGDFQLIAEHMEPSGAGKLQAEFEQLKKELHAKGWFDADSKRPLPLRAARIGVITSATGDALRDVLTVLKRRYPIAQVVLYPSLVQGTRAAANIARTIELANQRDETELLLLVRGGGSLEDLWAFNEVAVATAIRNSKLPIVSGVGHEMDITIADLVADQRAATPSAAAEMVTPDINILLSSLSNIEHQLFRQWQQTQAACSQRLNQWQARLDNQHPARKIQQQQQRVDETSQRLIARIAQTNASKQSMLDNLQRRLQSNSPQRQISMRHERLSQQRWRLQQAMQRIQQHSGNRLAMASRALSAISPLATLERGYAIVESENEVIRDASELAPGKAVTTRLGKGSFEANVTHIHTDEIL